ncbi:MULTISPECIES: type II toxin-antitoxin system RelE/ParE family toxin [unclassified Bradyrhizobium]|uniref:type II toxin-antitoxin system RelE/ParE family toxin n=1 Tax=unclassified Bradyrhizobium TaxID=2631580 RepID=UPI003082279C
MPSALPRLAWKASASLTSSTFEGKLWELRLTGRDGIARALYVTAIGRRVVVLRAFMKKTQKTPRTEIELALRRANEIT